MKKHLLLIFCFLILGLWSSAQDKKYILVEHFTNTPCPVCSSRNPQLNSIVELYKDDVHHISFHPPYPYSSCIFYQANKSENVGRAEYYGVQGSPSAVVQGTLLNGSPLLPEDQITSRLSDVAQVSLIVSETSGSSRSVDIEIKNLLDIELSGNYKLYVAVVEKEIQYAAPNGEQVHHNVFRRFLNGLSGTDIGLIPETSSQTLNFDYTLNDDWDADEIYIIAYLQNADTDDILNSGSSQDAVISSSSQESTVEEDWNIFPNPAKGVVRVTLPSQSDRISIQSITGQVVFEEHILRNSNTHYIDVSSLRKGTYFLRVESANRVYTRKLLRI